MNLLNIGGILNSVANRRAGTRNSGLRADRRTPNPKLLNTGAMEHISNVNSAKKNITVVYSKMSEDEISQYRKKFNGQDSLGHEYDIFVK